LRGRGIVFSLILCYTNIEYWLDLADYDIETAKVMLKGGRYLYVGFMCHQTIEKALKAIIARDCEEGEFPPKIHDLAKLAARSKLFDKMTDEQKVFIEYLNPLNNEARYPAYKKRLLEMLTSEKCEDIFTGTEELLCWIMKQL
jgi:HEPN domain-containing protein